ncbi:MAG: PaaI family thioesterase [Chloroflexi bacterium]|nr:PaaI family thioesterase [Chloroflexota bacterium]
MNGNPHEVAALINSAPLAESLDIKLDEVGPGYARASLSGLGSVQRWDGRIHGGAIMTLADQAFAGALHSAGLPHVGVQFNIHFVAPAWGGRLVAEARTVHQGKTMSVVDITVTDEGGRVIARATATGLVENRA